MKNIIKSYFGNKRGMTLVEVLTAMAILSLLVFCFTPLFLTYYKSIAIAGDEVIDVQNQSGILQTVIGNFDAGKGGNYSANVSEIALELTTPASATLTRDNSGTTVSALLNGAVTVAIGDEIDDVKGDFLASDPESIDSSYVTIKAQGSSAGLVCYPKSLTDDFVEAKIIIYGSGGINFADTSYATDFKLSCGVDGATELSNGTDYTVRKLASSMLEFTIYGGGKVSFETSPLIFNYKTGQHILQVEVDAPSMIMVGEQSDDGKYYYYVSRGEIVDGADSDSTKNELAIIRREMSTYDSTLGKTVTLNSAMNDVEWVPADSGDGYNVDGEGNKYGYYVMCGDNGQIRRFWRNNTTGNYYWGGDYTYYTDINNDEVDTANRRYISTKTYSTTTDYSYVYRGSHNAGFVMGGYSDLKLMNANTFTINALDTNRTNKNTNISVYIPDGEIYWFEKKGGFNNYPDLEDSVSTRDEMHTIFYADDDYDNATIGKGNPVGLNRYWNINLATDWFAMSDNSVYYLVNGQEQNTNMITLTSVDAICITGNGTTGAGGPYYSTATDGAQGYFGSVEYPTSSYTLYCGYIPAVMDVWSNGSSRGDGVITRIDDWDSYSFSPITESSLRGSGQADISGKLTNVTQADFSSWPRWKGTLGITAYATPTSTTSNYEDDKKSTINYGGIQKVLDSNIYNWGYYQADIVYYPFTNVAYFPSGKVFDKYTPIDTNIVPSEWLSYIPVDSSRLVIPQVYVHDGDGYNQQNVTGGQVVDITMSYLSHPLAIARTLNPTDDKIFDNANNKEDNRIFYWHNNRESATYLDCASTVVAAGDKDIPVSLLVGYITGGLAEYTGGDTDDDVFVNAIMNNGIVLLRAGTSNTGVHNNSDNFHSNEDIATDSTGYELQAESNAFHQFYYLNSRTEASDSPQRSGVFGQGAYHIGQLYGADYWENNRHIQYISTDGTAAYSDSNTGTYSYLRSHPMSNTKVTCVAWGVTWHGYPEAMWGTENGDLLSWWVNTTTTSTNDETDSDWNDKSVDAEFQSYKWVDNCNGKTFSLVSYNKAVGIGDDHAYWGTVGSAVLGSSSNAGSTFSVGSDNFKYFYDKTSQAISLWGSIGFISTLENINDIAYDNDLWVAVGDQSDVDPADYCASGSYSGGGEAAKAYSDTGRGGSWVNVRYWVDTSGGSGVQSDTNAYYHWRAVKISSKENYNIVQINNLDGIWIATGYEDANNNDEYDDGERTVVCWARNPLRSCNETLNGGWCEKVQFYANNGTSMTLLDQDQVGGINSCATRTE